MKTQEKLIEIWGEDLYKTFGHHIDDDGWLTSDWHKIIEDEIPRWDNNLLDNEEYGLTYGRMYNIDFEDSNCGTKIRRTDLTCN